MKRLALILLTALLPGLLLAQIVYQDLTAIF